MTQTTENSAWPVRSILLWGTFGPETAAGRQFQRRCIWALILMVVGQVAALRELEQAPVRELRLQVWEQEQGMRGPVRKN